MHMYKKPAKITEQNKLSRWQHKTTSAERINKQAYKYATVNCHSLSATTTTTTTTTNVKIRVTPSQKVAGAPYRN